MVDVKWVASSTHSRSRLNVDYILCLQLRYLLPLFAFQHHFLIQQFMHTKQSSWCIKQKPFFHSWHVTLKTSSPVERKSQQENNPHPYALERSPSSTFHSGTLTPTNTLEMHDPTWDLSRWCTFVASSSLNFRSTAPHSHPLASQSGSTLRSHAGWNHTKHNATFEHHRPCRFHRSQRHPHDRRRWWRFTCGNAWPKKKIVLIQDQRRRALQQAAAQRATSRLDKNVLNSSVLHLPVVGISAEERYATPTGRVPFFACPTTRSQRGFSEIASEHWVKS